MKPAEVTPGLISAHYTTDPRKAVLHRIFRRQQGLVNLKRPFAYYAAYAKDASFAKAITFCDERLKCDVVDV